MKRELDQPNKRHTGKVRWSLALLSVLLVLEMAGCGSEPQSPSATENNAAPKPATNQTEKPAASPAVNPIYNNSPVTLKWYDNLNTGDNWDRYIADPIRKKYPNVTLVNVQSKTESLQDAIAANDVPDIIERTTASIPAMLSLNLQYDMTDLLKKYNFDTSRIIPSYMQDLQAYGDKGQIWGLPMSPSLYGTLYNKDLFDKFGVPYPRDDMTWEETLELAKRVTRQDGGVQYRGLDMTGLAQLYTEKKLNPIPAGDKAVVSTAPWQNLAKVWKSIYEIPGNEKRASGSIANFYDPFLKGQLAMLSLSAISIVTRSQPYPDLKWDLVTFPTFKETPKTAPYANFKMIGISSTSKHKDEAFAVIASLFSDETQLTWAQSAVYATVLNNPQIQTAFAANIPTAKGKNMAAFYKHELSHLIYNKYFTGDVSKALTEGFDSILNDGVDINTALREAEENMNKAIAAAKAAQ